MSSVFKSPKVKHIEPEEVKPEIVDDNEIIYELEKKRKKKFGAVAQLLVADENYDGQYMGKKKLGE